MAHRAPTGKDLADFIAYVNRVANDKRTDAGFAGSWGDNGASVMETNIKTWHAGLEGRIPESLEPIWNEYQKHIDPDHALYLVLKKKFE